MTRSVRETFVAEDDQHHNGSKPEHDGLVDPRGEDEAIQDAIEAAKDDLYIREEAKRQHDAENIGWVEPRTIGFGGLKDLPAPESLIGGYLDKGTVTILSGPSGKGKSFIALDWGLSVASGLPWLGHEVVAGSVLYVAAEGAHGQAKRYEAWLQEHNPDHEPMGQMVIDPVNLADDQYIQWLIAQVKEGGHVLVILDTWAKCTTGAEENSARDTGVIIAGLYKVRDAIEENGTTVLVVHHTGYDTKRARGSSAIVAGVDNVYDIDADDPHDMLTLKCSKRKDGEPADPLILRIQQVDLPVSSSCVVVEAAAPDGDSATPPGATDSDLLLEAIRKAEPISQKELETVLEWTQTRTSTTAGDLEADGKIDRTRPLRGEGRSLICTIKTASEDDQ